jgi:hypothetical protein
VEPNGAPAEPNGVPAELNGPENRCNIEA